MGKRITADALLDNIKATRKGPSTWFERLSPEHQALVLEIAEKAEARGVSSTQIVDALRAQGIVDITGQSWRYFISRRRASAKG